MIAHHREIEVRFLDIDEEALRERLNRLGAIDVGEDCLEEIIFYDKSLRWRDTEGRFVRLRKTRRAVILSYKHHQMHTADGTEEIEVTVSDLRKTELVLERIGLTAYRHQQKKRHTFEFDGVTIDIDTWPRVPTYVELEGPSEDALQRVAHSLALDWNTAVFENARVVIEQRYKIPVGRLRWFTFERFE